MAWTVSSRPVEMLVKATGRSGMGEPWAHSSRSGFDDVADQGVQVPEVGMPGLVEGRGLKSAGAGSISLPPT